MKTRRKRPVQARARQTVQAILDATAQVLVELGYHGATTNHIAQRAGVSIGSLYQYFPHKEALVLELGVRYMDEQFEILSSSLQTLAHAPLEEAVRGVIEALIRAKLQDPDLNRVLFTELPSLGALDLLQLWTERAVSTLNMALGLRPERFKPANLQLASYLIVNAMYGITTYTVLYKPQLMEDDRFIDELTGMMLGYLQGDTSEPQDALKRQAKR